MKDRIPTKPVPPAQAQVLDHKTLMALVDASQAMNGDLALASIFDRIAHQAATILRAEGASVLVLDHASRELVFETVTGPAGDQLRGQRVKADEGIAGQAIKTRRAVRVDDVVQNRNFFSGIDDQTKLTTRSLMAAPLIHRDNVIGVVEVINPLGRERFEDSDLELLRVFANLAAAAASNAQVIERITRENECLRSAAPTASIIGESPALMAALQLCKKVAAVPTTVLVTGETGTGKEMTARVIHQDSDRNDKPFIAVNCAALAETLLESELFGHEKGAFTGAADRKLGRFELADGGTLFLDEVGEMTAVSQTKLLRVLQEQEFTRVGGTETIRCDVRIIAATNRDLRVEVEQGRFREDLYYRLNIFPVQTPALRDRREDIPLLVKHFVDQFAPRIGTTAPTVGQDAMAAMMRYDWPGNIRELRNVVERCTLLAEGQVGLGDLPAEIARAGGMPGDPPAIASDKQFARTEPHIHVEPAAAIQGQPMTSRLAEQEKKLLINALEEINWNQSAAARLLGISRDHVRYRMKKYGLKKPAKR